MRISKAWLCLLIAILLQANCAIWINPAGDPNHSVLATATRAPSLQIHRGNDERVSPSNQRKTPALYFTAPASGIPGQNSGSALLELSQCAFSDPFFAYPSSGRSPPRLIS